MALLSISLLSLLALSLFSIYKRIIYPAFVSPLSKIPNAHWSSSISPLWILRTRYKNRENTTVHAAHLKLGPVIRLAPNELSINDVGGLRTVYAGGFEKGQWYSIFDNYGVPCMFSSWYSRTHSARKRMISNIYSKSNVHSSPALARQAQVILYDRLLPILDSAAAASKAGVDTGIEIHEIWNSTTMDFITAYLWGMKNGSNFLQDEALHRHWLDLYHSRKTHTFFPQELPRLTRFLKHMGIHLVPTWVDDANNELEDWCKDHCKKTLNFLESAPSDNMDVADQPVVLSTVLTGISKEEKKASGSVLSDTTLRYKELSIASEMIDHLAAGHETSGITLTYLAWHLSQDLSLQNELRKELLTLSPNMSLSNPEHEVPNSKDLDSLPLLHAVLMETLRLNAAIPGGQPRMTPFPSCTIGSFSDIPGGVRVGAQAYSVHRNESVYPAAEKWDYERWMDDRNGYSETQRRERDRLFWAFSSGGRMCVGSNFAMHEIKLVIAAVYTNFRTAIVNDDGIEQEDGYTCSPIGNRLVLRFERVSG